jgi:hypothetical protein
MDWKDWNPKVENFKKVANFKTVNLNLNEGTQSKEEQPEYYFDIINGKHIYPELSEKTLKFLRGDDDDDHGRGPEDDRRDPVNVGRDQANSRTRQQYNVSIRYPENDGRGQANSIIRQPYNVSRRYPENDGRGPENDDDDIVSSSYSKRDLYSGTPLLKKKGFFQGKIDKMYKIGKKLGKLGNLDTEILNSYVAKLLVLKYIIIKNECLLKLAKIIYPILMTIYPPNNVISNNVIVGNFYNEMISGKDNNTDQNYIFVDDENKTFNVELNIFTNYIEYIINNRKKSKEKINEIKTSIESFNKKDIKIYNIKSIINKQISFISEKLYYYITDYIIKLFEHEPNILNFKKKINKYKKFNDSNYFKFLNEIKKNKEMNIMKKSNNFDFDVDEKSSNNIIKKFINNDTEKFLDFINDIIECMKVISLFLYGKDQKKLMPKPHPDIDMKMYFHSTQFDIITLISDYIKNKDKYYLSLKI